MAKWCNDLALDALIDFVIDNCDEMRLCTAAAVPGEPSYSLARGSAALSGVIAMTSGEFTKQNAETGTGRQCVIAQQDDTAITVSGTLAYVILLDTTNSRVLYAMPTVNKDVVAASTEDIPTWSFFIRDPT